MHIMNSEASCLFTFIPPFLIFQEEARNEETPSPFQLKVLRENLKVLWKNVSVASTFC